MIKDLFFDMEEVHVSMIVEGDYTHENVKKSQLEFLSDPSNNSAHELLVEMFRDLNNDRYESYTNIQILNEIKKDIEEDVYLYQTQRA